MRILLADDHDLVRDSLTLLLQRLDTEVQVVHAATLPEALQKAETASFDLVLLDINMPGMNRVVGIEAMKRVVPQVPVVVVSGQITPDTVMDALKAGAAGFIPKTMAGKAMLNAIGLVLSGERYIPRLVLEGAAASGDGAASNEGTAALSRREREVLGLLASGLSNKEIARRLQVETVTVAVHLSSVYRKLGAANRTQAVRIALEQGLHLS